MADEKFDYDEARQDAFDLIFFWGVDGQVIIKGVVSGGFDANGDPLPSTPDAFIDGLITPAINASEKEINGTSILKGDKFVFFHSDIAPEINNQTVIGGQSLRIIAINDQNSPDDVINIYRELQLRV